MKERQGLGLHHESGKLRLLLRMQLAVQSSEDPKEGRYHQDIEAAQDTRAAGCIPRR